MTKQLTRLVLCTVLLAATYAASDDLVVPGHVRPAWALPSVSYPNDDKLVLPNQFAEVTSIQLAPPSAKELAGFKSGNGFADGHGGGGPTKVGFVRPVTASHGAILKTADLSWAMLDDGSRVAQVRVASPGAKGLRVGLNVNPAFRGEIHVLGRQGQKERNFGVFQPQHWHGRSEWLTPLVEGEYQLLQIRQIQGSPLPTWIAEIAQVGHMVEDPAVAPNRFSDIYPNTYSCHVNFACSTSDLEKRAGAAVGQMNYLREDGMYRCTGTLLTNARRSETPYFYTAEHCISDQAAADTLAIHWFFEYPGCENVNGWPSDYKTTSLGATLLHADRGNDHALLLLRDTPPEGVNYAGWDAREFVSRDTVVGIHHPNGDVKKISWGSYQGLYSPTYTDGIRRNNLLDIAWSKGVTQPGSSGSGLFTCDSQSCYLRGGLSGSPVAQCPNKAFYSRLSYAYPYIKQWLYDDVLGPSYLTVSPASIDFGSIQVGQTSAPQTITVSNKSGKTVTVTGIRSTGAAGAFTIASNGCSRLAAGQSCVATVTFSPVGGGGHNGSVVVESDADEPGGNVAIKGTGTLSVKTTAVSMISADGATACAVTKTLGAMCWGDNGLGQVGSGTWNNKVYVPLSVKNLTAVSSISTGNHSCAISNGGVYCWGRNTGVARDPTSGLALQAEKVPSLSTGMKSVVVGGPSGSLSEGFSCALSNAGAVKCWGASAEGQLGWGYTYSSASPVEVTGLQSGVIQITAAEYHACALTQSGQVKCWGNGVGYKLGDGTETNRLTPVTVVGLPSDIVAVEAGKWATCALTSGGAVLCWGSGSVANNSKSPSYITGLDSGVSQITVGSDHACAVMASGKIKCWGDSLYGRLGNGVVNSVGVTTPVEVLTSAGGAALTGVVAAAASTGNTCALTSNDGVKCWGNAGSGALGDDGKTVYQSAYPVRVVGLTAQSTVAVAAPTPQPPTLDISSAGIDFGQIEIGKAASSNVVITNSGSDSVSIYDIATAKPFIRAGGCGVLAGGASCAITVSYQPTEAKVTRGNLIISSNAKGSPHQIALSGSGYQPYPGSKVIPDHERLFNWAEKKYPELFAPSGAATQVELKPDSEAVQYFYRYYKDTKTYIAMAGDLTVYLYGPPFGASAVSVGQIGKFMDMVKADGF